MFNQTNKFMKYKLLQQVWMASKYITLGIALQCLFYSFLVASESVAQEPKSIKEISLSIGFKDESLTEIFKRLQSATDYNFSFNHEDLKEMQQFSAEYTEASLYEILMDLGMKTGLSFKQVNFNINVARYHKNKKKEIEIIIEDINVSGKVTDDTGVPLPGVNIVLKGTTHGTVTSVDGTYSINVPENGTLVFSFIGYIQEEIAIDNQRVLNVSLYPDIMSLEEIVVIGYGTQRRSSVVGAVEQVTPEVLEGRPSVNVTQALQGVAANLIVQQTNAEPGAGINLNIRGISTLGDNSPLVVIDGIIGGDINLLNPSDIESVSILKDAGSAAIYGSRANNGVILITTKKGKKNTRPAVVYNGLAGINAPHFFMTPVHGYENAMLRNESALNANGSSAVYSAEEIRQFKENDDNEWFAKEIVKPAWQQNHNLSLSGGGENSTYFVSVGYMDQNSNFVGPDKGIKRYNYRVNMTNEYDKFKLTTMLSYVRREITDHASNTGTLMADANRVPLYYKQKDSLGRYLTNDVLQEFNSLGILEQGGFRKYDDDNVFGNLLGEYAITDFLKVRAGVGVSLYANHKFERIKRVDYFPQGSSGKDRNVNDESRKSLDLNTQLMLEFDKTFSEDHHVNILVGAANENHSDRGVGIYKTLTDPELGTPITETIIGTNSYTSNQSSSENSLNSLFGRASYDYENKYYAELSFRYDGSSKFREGNRWGFFPSASVGYRLTEEDFMSNYKQSVGNLKLRASYGVLGNQNVGNYQYQTTYFTFPDAYGFNNSTVSGTGYNFANPDIRWERAATFNVGADLDFFRNALTLSLDYYNKVTSDILVPPAVPGVFGTDLPDFNAGKVGSKGWEVSLSYLHSGEVLSHMVSFNLADSKNEILEFQGEERLTGLEELQVLLKEGYPYNSYVGLKRDGYFQNVDEVEKGPKPAGLNLQPGDNRYVDVDDNGIIDDNDKVVFGNPFPRLTYGLTYNVGFKGFDLNVFLQGVGKRTMMIRGELIEPFHFNYGMTMYEHQLDYWTPQNTDARYPRLADNGSASNTNNFRRGSDMYLYDGAYLRVKNVQLGYTLPTSLAEKLGMQKLRAYVSGQNLYTLSKVKFVDPELSEFDNNMSSSGANSARAYPTMVFYGFGLDITF